MQLQIDARLRRLLRQAADQPVALWVRLVLIVVLAFQAARLFWALVEPLGPIGDWRKPEPPGQQAAGRIIQGFDPFFRLDASAAPATSGVVTNLQLTLFGTRMNDATGGGSAIIAGPDGEQKSYAVGEEVQPGVKLKAVAFDHITLDRGGAAEDLYIDQSTPAAPTVPAGDASPPPASLAAPASPEAGGAVTIADIHAGIGFIPRIDDGRVTGLTVRPQGSSDIFQRVGFRVGDVITKINGRPVGGAGDIESLAQTPNADGNVSISIERGAEVLPLVITVKGK